MRSLINFLKGIAFGVAVVIPGLSGSAFLVVLGLYEQTINAIAGLRKNIIKNFLFLLPIGLGGGIGVLISTRFVLWLCQRFPIPSYLLFIVLVLTAFPDVYKKIKKRRFGFCMLLLVICGFGFMIAMNVSAEMLQQYGGHQLDSYVAISNVNSFVDGMTILFAGFLSCGMMSVPGVSGSVILMMIGQYGTIYNAVANINIPIISLFAIGSGCGVLIASKFLSRIIAKFESEMYYVVMGILIGCILTLFVSGVLNIQFIEIIGRIKLCI